MFRGYFIRDIRNLWSGRVASYVVFALLLGLRAVSTNKREKHWLRVCQQYENAQRRRN